MAKERRKAEKGTEPPKTDWAGKITWLAFLLAIILVCVRATLSETLRDPSPVTPGIEAPPRGVGPAVILLLNLLCCVPALLVGLRRLLDKTYVIRWSVSHLILAMLAAWMLLSITWSADKFAAMVQSTTFAGAVAMLWAASQLVRSWQRLRLVAAAAFGALLIYVACGWEYRKIDLPMLQRDFAEHREERLKGQGVEPDSFAAQSYEGKIMRGDVGCFVVSPNSYGAVLVFLVVIAAGVIMQRAVSRDHPISWIVILVLVLPTTYVIYYTHSRTAVATPVLAGGMLGAAALLRGWLTRNSKKAYWLGFAATLLAASAVVGHGLSHGTLVEKSMTFRWYYWTGAAKLVQAHPLTGVGWSSFGQRYTAVRGMLATEEVQDPHNLVVRAFAELGFVGGLLMLAWMARLWWEITRPIVPPGPSVASAAGSPTGGHASARTLLIAAAIQVGFFILGAVLASDWEQSGAWIFLQIFRRGAGSLLLVGGLMLVAQRSMRDEQIDGRPAPWILRGCIVALAIFFIHNLIDFSLFETGPMYLFALVAGAVLGVRQPSMAGRRRKTALVAAGFTAALLLWLWGAGYFWARTAMAEGLAAEGDAAVRANYPELAATRYVQAFTDQPLNAEYAFKAADAGMRASRQPSFVRSMIDAAIAANPYATRYLRLRAHFELQQPSPLNGAAIEGAYRKALELDPHNVALRIEFADALIRLGDHALAKEQYREALRMDDALPADEPKRLGSKRRREVEQKV